MHRIWKISTGASGYDHRHCRDEVDMVSTLQKKGGIRLERAPHPEFQTCVVKSKVVSLLCNMRSAKFCML